MNEQEARKKIKALKAFYGHLLMFAVFMPCLAVVNFLSYRSGDPELWVIYPLVFWGAAVFLNGLSVHTSFGWGRKWEEQKLRELTGWSATQEELARLSERVETLLRILSNGSEEESDAELREIRKTLLDAKRAIHYYQSPLDQPGVELLDKRAMVKAIERLEAVLTSRAFQRIDDDAAARR